MRKPEKAPDFFEVFRNAGNEILDKFHLVPTDDRYFHWDELRHRQPPAGISRRDWWCILKMRRQGLRQTVALVDETGQHLNFGMTPKILESVHQIDLRAGGQIRMPEQVTNHETKDVYYVSSLIEEAITSSQLEGATTTRRVAKEMLVSGRAPRDRSERMILNNFVTMKRIGELKNKPLSPDLIREIHEFVTHDTLDDPSASGRFRTDDEKVGVYDNLSNQLMHKPPPVAVLDERITALCDFANASEPFVHPVIRSILLHFMLGYEHPFVDGNGRTARALFYWSMLRHGYWLVEFISISQIVLQAPAQYARAYLYTETDELDATYFILYHLKIVMRALASLHDYIARKAREIQQFEHELQGVSMLNHRQRDLVRHAMRHPGANYTVKGHQQTHNVSYESARSDLLDLVERELLTSRRESRGQGGRWVFTAQPQAQMVGKLAAMAQSSGT